MSLGEAQVTIGVDDSGLNQKLIKVKNNILNQMVQMQKQIEATKRKAMQVDTAPMEKKILKVKKDILRIALQTEKELARIKRNALNLPPISTKPLEDAGKKGGAKFSKGIMGALQTQLGPKFGQLMGLFGGAGAVALSGPFIGAVAAITISVVAVVAAFKMAKAALLKFLEVGKVVSRLNSTLEITGTLIGLTTERIRKLAREMSNAGVISEKQILRSAAILATFTNIAGEEFRKALELTTDLARAMGVDARTAALQFGKALSQPSTGLATLREAGVIFTVSQREMIIELEKTGRIVEAQNLLFKILAENGIDGNAKATDDLVDKIDNLRNISENYLETLGSLIGQYIVETGVIDITRDTIISLTEAMDENSTTMVLAKDLFNLVGGNVEAMGLAVRGALAPLILLSNVLNQLNDTGGGGSDVLDKIASRANNLRNILITNQKAIEDAIKTVGEKEDAIFRARGDRAAREIIKDNVFRKLKIKGLQDQIKAQEQAKKDAQAPKATEDDIEEAKKNIEQLEGVEKAIGKVIKALRKRKLVQSGSTFSGAERAFEQRIKRDAKALNDKRKMERDALIEAAQAEKEKIKEARDNEKQRLDFLNKKAKDQIELAKMVADARIQILKDELKKRKELLTEFTQQGLEDRDLEILKSKSRETTKAGTDAIEKALKGLLATGGLVGINDNTKKVVVDALRLSLRTLQGPEGVTELARKQGVPTGLSELEGRASDRVVALEAAIEASKKANKTAENTSLMAGYLEDIAVAFLPLPESVKRIADKPLGSIFF